MTGIERYLETRSRLSNQDSEFHCPDSCPRFGCKEPGLHVPVTLVDLILESAVFKESPTEIYRHFYKIGWLPVEEQGPWVGRLTLELKKPCGFLEGKLCRSYPARPIGCAQFPEAWFIRQEDGSTAREGTRLTHYPCLKEPPPVSNERKKHLALLSKKAAQEGWVSDFYLFGYSPFYVDLKKDLEEMARMAEEEQLFVEKNNLRAPQFIPHSLVEEFFQRKLESTGMLQQIGQKVARLDSPEGKSSLFALKEITDKIATSAPSKGIVLYHTFEGKTLQRHEAVWRGSFRWESIEMSE